MLTKEECLEAFDLIDKEFSLSYYGLQKERECIKQLIEEHFDNSPLRFEELKEDMWVWDNYDGGGWLCIAKIDKEKMRVEDGYFWEDYKENRFYRKEVD